FDWPWWAGAGGSVPNDYFSVRWTRYLTFDGNPQWLHGRYDDGMRVFLDGELIADHWACCSEAYDLVTPSAGEHLVTVEYLEVTGAARAFFELVPALRPVQGWSGTYYGNTTFSGSPVLARMDPAINFDWPWWTGPGGSVPNDNFSVRWTRYLTFDGSPQWFHGQFDDGMRVYLDGELVADHWACCGEAYDPLTPSAGEHLVTVEFMETTGAAHALFEAVPAPRPVSAWSGAY